MEVDLSGRGIALASSGARGVVGGVGVNQGGARWLGKARTVARNAAPAATSRCRAPAVVGLMLLLLFAVVCWCMGAMGALLVTDGGGHGGGGMVISY